MMAEGRGITAPDYLAARDMRRVLRAGLDPLFARFDAILTPAAPGEAPEGLDSTGDPVFCGIWTFCGLPAVTLPLLTGPAGLPVGVQLVGASARTRGSSAPRAGWCGPWPREADMVDKVLALVALLTLSAFVGVVVVLVPRVDLAVVSILCVGLAWFDFARELFRSRNGR